MQYKRFSKNEIIKASEIGQYSYCSVAWHLQRCGYEPKSPMLDVGTETHVILGQTITSLQEKERSSRYLTYLGYILVFMALLVLLGMVIL